jgi:hypothetical protein
VISSDLIVDFAWYLGFGDLGWSAGNRLFGRRDC